jgi:type I restriction enzyme S subunit
MIDLKKTPIGIVPTEWTGFLGKDVTNKITKGSSPKWQGFDYQDSGVLFITSENVRNGFLDLKEKKFLPKSFGKKAKGSRLSDGDILINIVGASIGRTCVFSMEKGDAEEVNINQAVCLFRPKKDFNREYLSYYLQSPMAQKLLKNSQSDSARPNISLTDMREFPFILPNESEQRIIVDILKRWDYSIGLVERLIAEKKELRKGLTQQLLTGKQRFPIFVKNNVYDKTRYGEIPKDWAYPKLGDVACHVNVRNQKNRVLPVLSCTKHQGLVDSLKYFGRQVFSKNLGNYKIVKRGQFAYATNHIEEGSIGYQDLYEEAVISPMYTVFETGKMINDRFLYLLVKTELYRRIFESMTSSSVNRRGSLRWKEFSKIHIPLPSLKEQGSIVQVFETIDLEICLLDEKLRCLVEQKKGLMQQLLTGKIRVKVPETDAGD